MRRLVGGGDGALGVETQHAGADPRKDGLDELAAEFRLLTGRLQRPLLDLKIMCHPVECMG